MSTYYLITKEKNHIVNRIKPASWEPFDAIKTCKLGRTKVQTDGGKIETKATSKLDDTKIYLTGVSLAELQYRMKSIYNSDVAHRQKERRQKYIRRNT